MKVKIPLGTPHHPYRNNWQMLFALITSVYIFASIRRNSRFTTKTQYPDPYT